MDLIELNHYYHNPLSAELAEEQKTVFLLEDVSVNLLKYEQHKATNKFLDFLPSNMFLPHNVQPTRITSHWKAPIDNIFSNFISQEILPRKLTAAMSDHLPEFLIAPLISSNIPNSKTNIFEHDWSKFNHEEFIQD